MAHIQLAKQAVGQTLVQLTMDQKSLVKPGSVTGFEDALNISTNDYLADYYKSVILEMSYNLFDDATGAATLDVNVEHSADGTNWAKLTNFTQVTTGGAGVNLAGKQLLSISNLGKYYRTTYKTSAKMQRIVTGAGAVVDFDYSGAGNDVGFGMTLGDSGVMAILGTANVVDIDGLVLDLNTKLAAAYAGTVPLTGTEFAKDGGGTNIVITSPQAFTLAAGAVVGYGTNDWLAILDPGPGAVIVPGTWLGSRVIIQGSFKKTRYYGAG